VREISSVFGDYGISVDPRHLSLVADYMVRVVVGKKKRRKTILKTNVQLTILAQNTNIGILNIHSPIQNPKFSCSHKFLHKIGY